MKLYEVIFFTLYKSKNAKAFYKEKYFKNTRFNQVKLHEILLSKYNIYYIKNNKRILYNKQKIKNKRKLCFIKNKNNWNLVQTAGNVYDDFITYKNETIKSDKIYTSEYLGYGSEGIVFHPPILPLETEINFQIFKNNYLKDIELNEEILNIIRKYFDLSNFDFSSKKYIGKNIYKEDYNKSIKNAIMNDIKIKLIQNKLNIESDKYFATNLYKITLVNDSNLQDYLQIDFSYFLQLVYNYCGEELSETSLNLSNFTDLVKNIQLLNDNNIIHMDIRFPNILHLENKLMIIDFGLSSMKQDLYDNIYLYFPTLVLFPLEYCLIYLLKDFAYNGNNINNIKSSLSNREIKLKIIKAINLYIEHGILNLEDNQSSGDYYKKIKEYYISLLDTIEEQITIENVNTIIDKLLGHDYYKKIDTFYLSFFMIYITELNENINKCLMFEKIDERYTIDELYHDINHNHIRGGKLNVLSKKSMMTDIKEKTIKDKSKVKLIPSKYMDISEINPIVFSRFVYNIS